MLFDVVPFLEESDAAPQMPKYGGHPNEEGSRLWAEKLFDAVTAAGLLQPGSAPGK